LSAALDLHLSELIGGVEVTADGRPAMPRPPANPRFEVPLSGLYWQVEAGTERLRSRSLWDQALNLPMDQPADAERHDHWLSGPAGQRLLVAERVVRLTAGDQPIIVRLAAATDLADLAEARRRFMGDLSLGLAVLAAVLLSGAAAQVYLGLEPLRRLARAVGEVRHGARDRVEGRGPAEVQPLVEELNGLIEARETAATKARHRAADLAHGLKTPLAALAHDAGAVARLGHQHLADEMHATLDAMRRHVDRELTRARLETRDRSKARASVDLIARRVAATLARTPDGERVTFELGGDPEAAFPLEADDLAEALGNLLENAARHAEAEVRVQWTVSDTAAIVSVEDDGPGLSPADRARMLERGARLDQRGPGNGLGLAIVADIATAYGGCLTLDAAGTGGLRAEIKVPNSVG
jgi:signal transduction histidine kinase